MEYTDVILYTCGNDNVLISTDYTKQQLNMDIKLNQSTKRESSTDVISRSYTRQ